jgi:hypothetical protein
MESAKRLQFAVPELVLVAPVRLYMVGLRRWRHDARFQAVAAQRLSLTLRSGLSLPCALCVQVAIFRVSQLCGTQARGKRACLGVRHTLSAASDRQARRAVSNE